MSIDTVREYLSAFGVEDRIRELALSSATVPLAAQALGCAEERIAKTLSFHVHDQVVLVVRRCNPGTMRLPLNENADFQAVLRRHMSYMAPSPGSKIHRPYYRQADLAANKTGAPAKVVAPLARAFVG